MVNMEKDIELELSKLSLPDSESPAEDVEEDYDSFMVIEEFPESVLSFLQSVKQRSEKAEKLILEDLDSTDTWTSDCFPVSYKHQVTNDSDYFVQLASENHEDPETFKKRVLAEIEEDDRKDLLSCDNPEIEDADVSKGDAELVNKLDGVDEVLNFCYTEVEESCRQKLQQWQKEQENHKEVDRAALNAQKAVLEKEIKEQDEKRENWEREFEKELSKLSTFQQKQQEKLELDLKRNYEALEQDLQYHQNKIDNIEADLIVERKAFEEQKANAQKRLEELQHKAAVTIQAAFRAHQVYKVYASILLQKKEDLKRKKELQQKMEIEKKELEQKIRMKLEEKRQKDEEKKQNEEIAKKKIEEAKRKEFIEQGKRHQEYEWKKNEEKMRLEKAKFLKQQETSKQEMNSPKYPSINGKPAKEDQPKDEQTNALKIAEEKEERQEKNSGIRQEMDVGLQVHTSEKNTILESRADLEPAEIRRASEIDEDRSLLVHNKKSIESPSPVLTALPTAFTEGHVLGSQSAVNHIEEKDMSQNAGNSQSQTSRYSSTVNGWALPDQSEAKRLAWMKSCKPWAKILRENQKVVVKKARQRKSSAAKQLPSLKEALILHNTPWQNLQQVTTVTLHDLPGCSLSTLSKCVNLKFLSLRRCQLSALEGLSNCKALQYLDVQDNCISFINCEGLENLVVLLLNKNRVTSINGIEDCKNLMTLELSFNSVTRIAGLESLRNLQWLALDHNQLISTKALETTPQLTYLDCSYNYLTELEGIQNCGLLQILKLQGNNLSEIPRLDNHVLMRELYLDDNNLTTMTDMSSYWLPLLQVFTVSQNSITHLEPFNTFISLEELNLSSNCLSDLETVTLWLEGCMNLRKLSISKNPFLQEHNWRFTLQKTLPALRCLNDEEITSEDTPFHKSPPGSFMAFCQHQISNIHKLWHVIDEERQSPSLEKLDMYCNSLKEILQLSNVYRYAHEYGDTDVAEREDPENQLHLDNSQHSSHIILGPHEDQCEDTKQITIQHAKSLLEQSFVNAEQSDRANNRGSMKYQSKLSVTSTRKDIKGHSREVSAAVLIQSQWRGYIVRRDIHYYTKLHEAASLIQSAWRYYYSRKKSLHKKCANPKTFKVREQAATVIQAAWKGFFLRKKLAAAFAGIDREELEDDFEEVNLDEFTFDENVFEKGWSVDSALSHSGALHIFSKPERPKKTVLEEDREYSLPWSPQEAWAVSEGSTLDKKHRYEKDGLSGRSEKHNLSHVYSMKSNTDISFKSEKEEKISQEWGFKEVSTAQLMLKRAQKMKSKQAKHKKMLDPAVRLALFKNNENKHSPVMPPKKAQPTKIEYIQGKEEELCYLKELPSEALARSRELTYQWLHTQYGNINTTSTAISKCKGFLPELNHDVLHGGRVQLVAKEPLSKEADDIDLMSLKSGSTLSQNREEKVKTQRSSGTLSNRNVCVPVKTNTGPQRKERISFRDNPVQLSGGWGGGKKKGKAVK
ncbi:leucine-rich repeat and IQ domain-containing protein 1 isoform X1 [Hyla sarda]|uniref:leucine-rich repeat and IQ domain-containing protein 1 isoform X1 n=1 Tax=Hyla sarda TaxID=327740 RepID=UPI0024C3B251|nr:leucine-rich repeat and IQ domain-containing protein 1 isoform X1 [Hyla sarda]